MIQKKQPYVAASVFLDGFITRPGIAERIPMTYIERYEIPEPLELPEAMRRRLRGMEVWEREDLMEMIGDAEPALAEKIKVYDHYLKWLNTRVDDELRCNQCNRLYTNWADGWFDHIPFNEWDDALVDGWNYVKLPLDLSLPADQVYEQDGFDCKFAPCCPECMEINPQPKE